MSFDRQQHNNGTTHNGRSLCACIIGTRPEVIKMAPVIRRLAESRWATPYVIAVGQHTHLLDMAIKDFDLSIDQRIEIVRSRGSITEVMARAMDDLDVGLEGLNPACVVAQGDTTTVLAAGMAAFYRRIPFVHVEAGLRTGDITAPFPEEFNRRAVALATSLHCAPTARAKAALIAEGASEADCILSGNTVIDALLDLVPRKPELPPNFPAPYKTILLTAHRRESFGQPLERAFLALREMVERYADLAIFFPVHPNPNTKLLAERLLGGHPRIVLSDPVNYPQLVAAMQASWLVVTDSGGMQEEGPALGKPVLVLRDVTERPEALETGVVKLVGTDHGRIVHSISELHDDPQAYRQMARAVFPYGDGRAGERIVDAMFRRLMPDAHAEKSRQYSLPVAAEISEVRS